MKISTTWALVRYEALSVLTKLVYISPGKTDLINLQGVTLQKTSVLCGITSEQRMITHHTAASNTEVEYKQGEDDEKQNQNAY